MQVENYVFQFEDGSHIQLSGNQFQRIWEDIQNERPNPTYERLKAKLEQGFPDDAGLIYLMKAEDPNEYPNLWE